MKAHTEVTQVDHVTTTAVRQIYRPAEPNTDEPRQWKNVDISAFVSAPSPLPRRGGGRNLNEPPADHGSLVVYDLAARDEKVLGKAGSGRRGHPPWRWPATRSIPAWPGETQGALKHLPTKDFNSLALVSDPTAGNFKTHVKMAFFHFCQHLNGLI